MVRNVEGGGKLVIVVNIVKCGEMWWGRWAEEGRDGMWLIEAK